MAKKMSKKLRKKMRRLEQQAGGWNGNGGWRNGTAAGPGLFGTLSRALPKGRTEQFLLGAAVGVAAAYVLSDEDLRGKLMTSGIKLYTGLLGNIEELKEQAADIQAEMAAEHGSDV